MATTKILVVDNYDSFVFNLVQYLGQLGAETTVVRNDEISVEALAKAIFMIINEQVKFDPESISKHARKQYNMDDQARLYLKLYEDILLNMK